MSNNFLGSDTKNIKKGKTSKSKGKGKKASNGTKDKHDNNEFQAESDEEIEPVENKKVKTEGNSETKIVIPAPLIFTESYLETSLLLLRKLGSETEALYLCQKNFYVLVRTPKKP